MKKTGLFSSVKITAKRALKSVGRAFQLPQWVVNFQKYIKPDYQSTAQASSKKLRDSIWTTACISRYTSCVPSVSFICQRWNEELKEWVRAPDHPIENRIDRPNDYQPTNEFMATVITNLLKDGNALISILHSKVKNETLKLEALHTDGVEPVLDGVDLIEKYRVSQAGFDFRTTKEKLVDKKDMIHIRLVNTERLEWGISPLEAASDVQDGETMAMAFNKNIMAQQGRPSMVLASPDPLSKNQRRRLARAFAEDTSGDNSGLPLVLTHGVKPVPIGSSPLELDYIKSSYLDADRICALLKVPPPVLGLAQNATLANLDKYVKLFWTDSVIPLLTLICQAFTHYWVQPNWGNKYRLWFDTTEVISLKEDLKDKIAIVSTLFKHGYSMNELNRKLSLGMPEIPNGDIRVLNKEVIDWGDFIPVGQTDLGEPNPVGRQDVKPIDPVPGVDEKRSFKTDEDLDRLWSTIEADRKAMRSVFEQPVLLEARKTIDGLIDIGPTIGPEGKVDFKITQNSEIGDWPKLLRKLWYDTANYALDTFDSRYFKTKSRKESKSFSTAEQVRLDVIANQRAELVINGLKHHLIDFVESKLSENMEIPDIVALLREKAPELSQFKAEVIVENEVLASFSTGNNAGAFKTGTYTQKKWHTRRDRKVRQSHVIMEGETKLLSEAYSNRLSYPCDPSGPPEEIMNCRCFESYV